MKIVITYGTYDLLHYGHIRLLERAKALGDYLIVGVTSDDFDKARGKINTKQSLIERIKGVEKLGIADKVIVEEYAGQKIDDIKKYNVDVFAIGSDWLGKFDYLKEYCEVIYLDRTNGISSTQLRSEKKIKITYVGDNSIVGKFYNESQYVNSIERVGICSNNREYLKKEFDGLNFLNFDESLDLSDAYYVLGSVDTHYSTIKKCLDNGKHVLCESPITKSISQYLELKDLARKKGILLMDSIKTAYSLAYHRLLLLIKGGIIGRVVSIDVTCTSMSKTSEKSLYDESWTGFLKWGPTAMLPVFDILGVDYIKKQIITSLVDDRSKNDKFTNISFIYKDAIATIKVGNGFKSEGNLVISGTKGCIFVGAPWWKMDYFEVHFENQNDNKRFFYQLDGEGIRNELVQFCRNILDFTNISNVNEVVSKKIIEIIEEYYTKNNVIKINF